MTIETIKTFSGKRWAIKQDGFVVEYNDGKNLAVYPYTAEGHEEAKRVMQSLK